MSHETILPQNTLPRQPNLPKSARWPWALERFLTKIYVPIGQEARLDLPLDEAVPPSQRWLTAGGLFVVKPSRQSWLGFLVTLAICVLCVIAMQALLKG